MWSRGGRSVALDRAEALLSGKRNTKITESIDQSRSNGHAATTPGRTGHVGGSVKKTAAPPNTHTLFLELSESSVGEQGDSTVNLAAARESQWREGDSPKDPRPQTSLGGGGGGGGSRFLKKATPPATASSQSPAFSKSQMQQPIESRYVSSQHSSQSTALSKLALIEERIRMRKQAQTEAQVHTMQGPKPAQILASDLGISPQQSASQSLDIFMPLSAQSSSGLSPKERRFIKKRAAAAADSRVTATSAVAPKGPDVSVKTTTAVAAMSLDSSRAVTASTPLASLGAKQIRVASGVTLDSDEEDMRKLLGDSLDSTEDSLLRAGRISSMKTAGKLGRISHKASPTPPLAVRHSSSYSRESPASPQCGSPSRFSRLAQARRSPSSSVRSASVVLSLSPSRPYTAPSPPGRVGSSSRARSPPRSLSSTSGHSEVHSLEELFPVAPGSEDCHSERSGVSSEDFKINIMTLDDLAPVSLGFTEETMKGEKKKPKTSKHKCLDPGALAGGHQLLGQKEEEEEDVLDYKSDFESDFESASRTKPGNSGSEVSERLGGDGEEEEQDVSETRGEVSESDKSRGRREDSYSDGFSDTSRSYTMRTTSHSKTSVLHSRSTDSYSGSSAPRSDWSPSHTVTPPRQSRRHPSPSRAVREAAVQTHPHALAYTWTAALSAYSPAVFALNDMLRQQLAITRHFIHTSRHLHSSLVQSLGAADYTYTTLEDTKEFICKHKPPKVTMEQALEEVLQEMKDYHYI
ncbi:uncharacterized protein C19orf44 homolog isoform 2-T2 [Polymixia lowei]